MAHLKGEPERPLRYGARPHSKSGQQIRTSSDLSRHFVTWLPPPHPAWHNFKRHQWCRFREGIESFYVLDLDRVTVLKVDRYDRDNIFIDILEQLPAQEITSIHRHYKFYFTEEKLEPCCSNVGQTNKVNQSVFSGWTKMIKVKNNLSEKLDNNFLLPAEFIID